MQPLILLTIINFMTQLRHVEPSTQYVVAVGLIGSWSYVLYSSGVSLIDEKWRGTMEYLVSSQTSLFNILITKTINNAFVGFLTLIITYLYAKNIYSFEWEISNYITFAGSLVVTFLSLMSLGTLLAVVFLYFTNVYEYQNLILYPIPIISGVFYPIEQISEILHYVASCLPLTWAISGLYKAINNGQYSIDLIYSIILSIVLLSVSFFLIKQAEIKMKNTGKMGGL